MATEAERAPGRLLLHFPLGSVRVVIFWKGAGRWRERHCWRFLGMPVAGQLIETGVDTGFDGNITSPGGFEVQSSEISLSLAKRTHKLSLHSLIQSVEAEEHCIPLQTLFIDCRVRGYIILPFIELTSTGLSMCRLLLQLANGMTLMQYLPPGAWTYIDSPINSYFMDGIYTARLLS